MADEDNEREEELITIKIDDDPVGADEGGKEGGESEKDAAKDLAAQFASLKTKNEEDARARADAERRAAAAQADADKARREVESARGEVQSSQLDTVTTALEAAQAAIETAQKDIQSAIELGDAKSQAEAQTRLSKATATAVRLEEAKDDLEQSVKTTKEGRKIDDGASREAPSDPVEAYVAGRPPRTQEWLRTHREYVTDPKRQAKLNAAHFDAVAEDIAPGTDAYFSHIENYLGLGQEGKVAKEGAKIARRETPTVAPGGSGAINNGSGKGGAEVRLTRGEAQRAQDGTIVWNYDDPSGKKRFKKGDPIGTQEFARRKLQMQKEGLYDKSQYEAS